ncbi:MAG: glucokinase [Alphaproteobacteria bacterium]|nr:glucokinase [Alphaproteobacteria bacterium]
MTAPVLLADVGGTFSRFAVADNGVIGETTVLESGTYRTFADAASVFLHDVATKPRRAAIAAAGPLTDGLITLTNGPQWPIARDAVRAELGLDEVLLVNDFVGLAVSAPSTPPEFAVELAPGDGGDGVIAVIGPGTGLGVALLAPRPGGGHTVLASEGGHAALAATNEREIAIVFRLMHRFGHVKAEYVLSGIGLEILWQTIAELDGVKVEGKPTAGEIAERARRKACDVSVETVAIFTGWLGAFTGDIALIAGASTVYLAGGVLPRWGTLFDTALFRRRFLAKGTHRPLMEKIPVTLITDPKATFRGLLVLLGDTA